MGGLFSPFISFPSKGLMIIIIIMIMMMIMIIITIIIIISHYLKE